MQLKENQRLACVDVPALPLQCLVRRQPELATQPAVIVDELHPQGIVLWTNRAARQAGVRTGARYGHALGLCGQLRAGLVPEAEQQAAITEIAEILRKFSPLVEPARQEPGVFWLDASGLNRFYPGLPLEEIHQKWTQELRQDLLNLHWHAAVVLGFDRLATYAIARHFRGVRVLADVQTENAACARVQLASLGQNCGIMPKLRDELERLGVETLGELARLPETALRERMGMEIAQLRRRLSQDIPQPLAAELPLAPAEARREFEPPDQNAERLLFAAKNLLDPLLNLLADRQHAVKTLVVQLTLDRTPVVNLELTLQPADPTLDARQLLDLIRLRLEVTPLQAPVKNLQLRLQEVPATAEQLALWQLHRQRNPAAAAQAFARLRALFGDQTVVHAVPRSAWLPEGQFGWQPLLRLDVPGAGELQKTGARQKRGRKAKNMGQNQENLQPEPPLPTNVIALPTRPQVQPVRRLLTPPVRLPPRPTSDQPWRLQPVREETVVQFDGPYALTGGWWRSVTQLDRCRDYGFATTDHGTVLWIFGDRGLNAWFCQGILE